MTQGEPSVNPLRLSDAEISVWSVQTQAIVWLASAHFDVFNAMEAECGKRKRGQYANALRTLYRAACHVREWKDQ